VFTYTANLYGSYARGDFNDNSDIDIMILLAISDAEIKWLLIDKKTLDIHQKYAYTILNTNSSLYKETITNYRKISYVTYFAYPPFSGSYQEPIYDRRFYTISVYFYIYYYNYFL